MGRENAAVLLDSVAAINAIDEATRVKPSHQTIVHNALNVDVRKTRFS